ncbi:LOW QUALITY PROTEIN: hypothetical protein KUTeg_007649 [Tegillarca granosa]|uniref:Solute carrier family 23 member 2 n=1 Tax=Tegillarca granosa TaxID=220873 RepID=A0ABQ9FDX5_TEGGR|nr:LOW QUALITY PROTEIN: hypothetical protein KUTeg_007649 [Tegillarca granosa]
MKLPSVNEQHIQKSFQNIIFQRFYQKMITKFSYFSMISLDLLQHYLTMLGGNITIPLLFAKPLCIEGDNVGLSEFISTIFFVCGIGTLLQSTVGVRLPIIQGASIAFLAPTVVLMSQPEWKCPYIDAENGKVSFLKFSVLSILDGETCGLINITDLPPYGSEGHKEIWKARLCQSPLSFDSRFVDGGSNIPGVNRIQRVTWVILKYVGPLSIAPTIALISLPVMGDIADVAANHWYIALTCFVIFIICAMVFSWVLCYILTVTNVFPSEKGQWGYPARTDIKLDALDNSQWFRVPYPGQWGMPTVSIAGVVGMLSAVLASMIESVGDYIACARLSGAPPPPTYAINRGCGTEGLIVIISGMWGSGPGLTSYSENIGAIAITKVGSRRVVQYTSVILLILGCLGKFGALFVTIPLPVIGGILLVTLGMVVSVGLSNLQFVNMSSSRNITILGTSLFFGLAFPHWIKNHPTAIATVRF